MVARGQSRHTHLAPRMWHTAKWPTDAGQMWRNREKQTFTPPKINESNLKMMVWKMIFLFLGNLFLGSMLIFRGV